jgi:2-oxoglutarate dehydrogenase E2 component (dihydrolipoamide succinyltransferase)
MPIEIKVPTLPESVADATVQSWHVKVGDSVSRDTNIVDLETDKVVLEVPVTEDCVVTKIVKQEGETVKSGEVLALMELAGKSVSPQAAELVKPVEAKMTESKVSESKIAAPQSIVPPSVSAPINLPQNSSLSPSQRRVMAEQGGLGVLNSSLEVIGSLGHRDERRVPMSRLRQRIAERLLAVKQNTAMLTTFNEIDMSSVMELRKKYKDSFEKKHGVKLGFMSFFTKACVEALKRFPVVNASIDGMDIVYHNYADVGIAVSTDRGLVVPVLRDADKLSMAELEKRIAEYGVRARDGKLSMEEITGGTFTITNGGVFGSMLSTPILNPPQSAILGMHNIVERPVVRNGAIVIRPIMYLALSYDHRIVDGKDSVQFLVQVKELLEDPARLLLVL